MISYHDTLARSWIKRESTVRGLADLLHQSGSLSLRSLLNQAQTAEVVEIACGITTSDNAPIGGSAKFLMSSDGSYTFSGYMRATGAYSYDFGVQAWMAGAGQGVVAAQHRGSIHGLDSIGDRQDNWEESGHNPGIAQYWRDIRSDPQLHVHMDADLSGVLGGALDVLEFALEGLVANWAVGPVGWILLIGSELAPRELQPGTPDELEGVLVAGGILFVLGPYGVIPAAVGGLATVLVSDVKHRLIETHEIAFADRIFAGKIDYANVVLTNMSHANGTKYTIPSIGGRILVNLDDAYDTPMTYPNDEVRRMGTNYPQPGSVFIHELTHAWQISHKSPITLICGLSTSYEYQSDANWPHGAWNGFDNEQQGHIVDDWYGNWRYNHKRPAELYQIDASGVPITDLDGSESVRHPAFRFIDENIRRGLL